MIRGKGIGHNMQKAKSQKHTKKTEAQTGWYTVYTKRQIRRMSCRWFEWGVEASGNDKDRNRVTTGQAIRVLLGLKCYRGVSDLYKTERENELGEQDNF